MLLIDAYGRALKLEGTFLASTFIVERCRLVRPHLRDKVFG